MYTHYWTPNLVTEKEWEPFLEAVNQLVKALPSRIKICGGDGTGKPTFNKEMIYFNGDATHDLDHETFLIEPKKKEWDFCKTAHKPYDLLVCAVLIAAHEHLGYEVSSDGDLDEWYEAIDFYFTTIFGRSYNANEIVKTGILPDFLNEQLEENQEESI